VRQVGHLPDLTFDFIGKNVDTERSHINTNH